MASQAVKEKCPASHHHGFRLQPDAKALVHAGLASVHLTTAFAASGRTYGSRRLCASLQAQGVLIGRHQVRSLMRCHQRHSVWKRKFAHTVHSKHAMPVAENVLERQFA